MHLGKPDPRFTSSPRARRSFALALKIALWMAGILWLILIVDNVLGLGLHRFGLRPGHLEGLGTIEGVLEEKLALGLAALTLLG